MLKSSNLVVAEAVSQTPQRSYLAKNDLELRILLPPLPEVMMNAVSTSMRCTQE